MIKRQQISFNPKDICHEHTYVPENQPKLNTYVLGGHMLTGTNVVEANMNFVTLFPKLAHMQICHICEVDTYGKVNIYTRVKYVTRIQILYTFELKQSNK